MKSYEQILEEMLNGVSGELDKREGSIIYTALAPCAAIIAGMYVDIETERALAFASTSGGEYLDMIVDEVGLTRFPATKTKRKASFKNSLNEAFNIDIKSRFSIETVSFKAVEKVTDGEYIMECETAGEAGNLNGGRLLPLDNIIGLSIATLSNDFIMYGTEEESDADLYTRYKLKVQKPITSGNANQYQQWALSVNGVGSAKVFPLWNGAGTVKVVITDTDKKPATASLITSVSNYIESVRPIGSSVSVVSAIAKNITIAAVITLASGYILNDVKTVFENALNEYFKTVALTSDYISYPKIGALLFSTPGVSDYTSLTVNSGTSNITLTSEETPVLASCEVTTS